MCKNMPPLELAIQFHGHVCPGLLFGVRVAEFAQHKLGVDVDKDEELLAVVENDSCAVDAVQSILGCTFGKGNLIFRDYGKQVYTIASRESGRAVRIAQIFGSMDGPEFRRFSQLKSLTCLSPQEENELEELLSVLFELIMSKPVDELFKWQETEMPEVEKATIMPSIECQICGEGVMQSRASTTDRGLVCPTCRLECEVDFNV
ncbi:MAG: FmdE family protein [Syntrophomonadaceae bacterium]|nr:FmdE family protein [Syntrophomonadaceae bacterium]